MLSTKYRLRLEFICKCIANGEEVKLDDMIWAEKLAKSHTLARDWLQKARRQSSHFAVNQQFHQIMTFYLSRTILLEILDHQF